MKTSDFYLKPSSSKINESIEKKFGGKLDLENYSDNQLVEANKLIETGIISHKKNGFNAALENEEFHRLTFMKDAVTTALAERKLSAAEKNKREKVAKAIEKEDPKMDKSKKMAIATAQAKKKVSESMQTMEELAMHHAMEYARHHMSGNIDHMKHHKNQCEECGGTIAHRGMGECWFTHGSKPPKRVLSPISGNTGVDTMTAEAKKSKNNDGNLANNAKPYDKVTRGDVIAGRLGKDEMGGKKKVGEAADDYEGEYQSTLTKAQKAAAKEIPAKNAAHKKSMYKQGKYPIQSKARNEQTLGEIGDTPKGRAALGSYINKAVANKGMNDRYSAGKPNGDKESDKVASQRAAGIKMAVNKLTRESTKAKPDFLDMDKDGNKKETMKKAVKDKKKSMNESPNYEDAMNKKLRRRETVYEAVNRLMNEGEEGKAELVMAVKDMVDKFTAWSEDIASMQATAAMEMADQIRDELGSDQSEAFKQAISPALDAAFQAVKGAREAMNNQVAAMTGGAPAMPAGPDMGAEAPAPDMGVEPDMGSEPDMGDEGDPALDMPPPEGREKRESVERHRRLARLLVGR